MKASIIISFYNKIDFLKLVLAGLSRQSEKDFEVIISDDGSRPDVVEQIKTIQANSPLTIKHNWHEDDGWQKNIILNKSVQLAQGTLLIFLDGDCIPHKHFVKDHLAYATANVISAGRRVMLNEDYSSGLTTKSVAKGKLENFISMALQNIKGGSHLEKGLRNPFSFLQDKMNRPKAEYSLSGCNFSMYKEDILKINGFDERYLAACVGEDTDLEKRFLMAGGKVKRLKNIAITYHIWHKRISRAGEEANMKLFNANIASGISFTPYGIKK